MKRCFSKALILALLAVTTLSPVSAETSDIVSENVEVTVGQATVTGDTGLTVEGEAAAPEQITEEEAIEESPIETDAPMYLRILADGTLLTNDAEGAAPLATLDADSVALLVADLSRPQVALFTEKGIVTGCIDRESAAAMTAEEVNAYLDEISADGERVALYQDDINRPLGLSQCHFFDTSEVSGGAEDEAGEADEGETGLSTEDDESLKVKSIKFASKTVSIGLKEKYAGLTLKAQPEGSAVPKVTWRSSNTRYVKVDSKTGVVTGVRKGSATVYAETKDGLKASCKVKVTAKPEGISVDSKSMTVSAGMTANLKATVKGGASGLVTFTSSKPQVAAVDENGVITALSSGKATIVAKTYNGKKAKCKVKVLNAAAALTFPNDTYSVAIGENASLTTTAIDSDGNATVANVTYSIDPSSPDASCISLDASTGRISTIRTGRAVVTATTHNNIAASCNVIVANAPTSVKLDSSSLSIGVGEVSTLKAELVPPSGEDSCATGLIWTTSDKSVATVDENGNVQGVGSGSCTIKVATDNGKTATCSVKVCKAPTSVSISPTVGTLKVGKTGKYKVTLSPDGSGGTVRYTSSAPSVATVDENGVVNALAEGVTYITVTTYNDKSAKAKLVVSASADSVGGKTTSEKVNYLISLARKQLGKPYIYGGGYADENPRGFDCSGLTYWLYKHVGVTLKDSAYRQGYDTRYTRLAMKDLQPGDVIFFNTNSSDSDLSDHAALYIGNGSFIHASSTAKKVILSSMSTPGSYYYRTFSWGHRIL